jgi:putative RNA 2'-phosphotransferase
MEPKTTKTISKFLSYVLRHHPELVNIQPDENGWVNIDELIEKSAWKDMMFSRLELEEVVATNDKKRFAISEDGSSIRASQGHSITVELGLPPTCPPDQLFHGTVHESLLCILAEGLIKGQRRHVHLSTDRDTAFKVGTRRGKSVILIVESGRMYKDGYLFYLSDNGVWLTDHVPAVYLKQ